MPAATPPFLTRYLAGELASFFDLKPNETIAALARRLERPRVALAAELSREAQRLGAPPEAHASLELLADPQSRVVVTGQQPGMLLGPAYSLAKAMSAIRLARELHSEHAPVVPVFWIAGQDHDTDEVDHAHLLDGEERLHRLEVPLPAGVASGSVPFRQEWLELMVDQLRRVGGRPEHVADACRLVEECSRGAESFADLFSGLIYRLLGQEGLLVLDPTRPGIAALFGEVLERELAEPTVTVDAITAAGDQLRRIGLDPQLGRGHDATNLFIDEPGDDGLPHRHLLRFDGRSFSSPTRKYQPAELQSLLREEPGRVTPAAGLRPVAQDAVLPTVAFVVGPGELRYLAQLRGVYGHHAVPMPLIRPRATTVVLEPPVRRILEKYGLDYGQYEAQRERAFERVLLERHGHSDAFEEALRRLEVESEELLRRVGAIDTTLEGTVERSRIRVERSIELLRGKAGEALLRNDAITRRHLGRLESHLFPSGSPQERLMSPFSFFLKFGVRPMMDLYRTTGSSGEHLLEP
ncbi:MAG: bacillithiol biosynthesis cysteine-adding enzyme BshC [Trueperaceae bacterium]